jgi:hypothetical protein
MCATDGGGYCADLATDNQNCGVCGTACTNGNACQSGHCSATCGQGLSLCTTDAGGYCSDLQTDPSNCQTCGHACGVGQFCSAGTCTSTCASGTTVCTANGTTVCSTLSSDNDNCGACGAVCGAGSTCAGGQCVYTEGNCADLLAADSTLTDGVYTLTAEGTAFQTYCDMTNGGYTLLLGATATGSAWGNSSGTWSAEGTLGTTPTTIDATLSADYKSVAYATVVTNNIRLCYEDTTHCHVFSHNLGITLLGFFQGDVIYTEYSSDTTNYANVGDDTMRVNYLTELGFDTDSAGMLSFWLGINQLNYDSVSKVTTGFSALGLLGDANCGAQDYYNSNSCGTNDWDDDYALGVGLQSCADGNGCSPGPSPNNENGTTESVSGAPSNAGPWFVFGM